MEADASPDRGRARARAEARRCRSMLSQSVEPEPRPRRARRAGADDRAARRRRDHRRLDDAGRDGRRPRLGAGARSAGEDAPAKLGRPRSTARSRLIRSRNVQDRSGPRRAAVRRRLHARLAAARVRLLHRKLHRRAGARRGHGAARVPDVDARRQRPARALPAGRGAARANGTAAAPGSTMGIAGCSAFGSHIGLVASASIGDDQRVKVHRLVAAVDCGRVVNSGLVAQQIEAGLIWALAQATVAAPEWVAGMPRARPIGGIGLPRLGDAPEIVVEIIPSSDAPGGISGLGTLPLAPAVANAIHAGSGQADALAAVRSDGGGMTARRSSRHSRAEDRRAADQPRHARRARGARGPPLSRRVPERPARDRNPRDRVEADPARHHPAHPAAASRPKPTTRSGPTKARRCASIAQRQAEALRTRLPGRQRPLCDALRQSGHRRGDRERWSSEGCTRILAAPLYPQYCAATTATANDAVFARAGADARGSRRCARCRLITTIRSTSTRCAANLDAPARGARFRARAAAAELPRNAAADARARRSLSLPLPEDRAAARAKRSAARSMSRSSRASAARNGSSRRPTRRSPAYPSERRQAHRRRRAGLFRRLPRDAGGARHPRPRDLRARRRRAIRLARLPQRFARKHRHARTR